MGNFIDTQVALDNQYWTQHKARLYKLLVVNEEAIGTNKGQVTHKTQMLQIIVQRYTKFIQLNITALGTYTVILSIPWLKTYNSQINW